MKSKQSKSKIEFFVMQALVSYAESDSDDDEYVEKHTENMKCIEIIKRTPECNHNGNASSANCCNNNNDIALRTDHDVSRIDHDVISKPNTGIKSDYFGLVASDSNDSDEPQCKNQKLEATQKIKIDEKEIELSVSEFWKNSESELLSEIEETEDEQSQQQNSTIYNSGRHCHKNRSTTLCDNILKRVHNFPVGQFQQYFCSTKQSFGRNKQPTATVQSKNNQTDELRPIYRVHSKISPHLHSGFGKVYKTPSKASINLPGHKGVVNRVKWCCPNYSHLLLSASLDGTVKVWNCWSQQDPCVRTLNCHNKAVKDAEWDSTGRTILSCSYDRTAALTDVETGKLKQRFSAAGYVTCGKFHPVQSNLIIVGSNNEILCWDIRSPETPVKTFTHKDRFGQVQDVIITRDGSQVFGSCDLVSRDSADRNIMAWDFTATVLLSNQIFQEKYVCTRLKLHPHEDSFLAQTHGNYVAIFSTTPPYTLNKFRRFDGHKMMGYSVGFDVSPDGKFVCSGSGEGRLYFYQYHSGKRVQSLDTGWDICMDVAYHPVLTSTLACSSWYGQIAVWN